MKMRSLLFTPLSLSLILSFTACQKTGSAGAPGNQTSNTDNNPLLGTWTLNSITWSVYTDFYYTDGALLTTITSNKDTTVGATGNYTFTDSSLSISHVSYSLNGSYADSSLQNNTCTMCIAGHTTRNFPDTSIVNRYSLIGQDSVFFPTGSEALRMLRSIGAIATAQSGAKFVIDGNTLTMTSTVDSVGHGVILGTSIVTTQLTNNRTVSVFQKQP